MRNGVSGWNGNNISKGGFHQSMENGIYEIYLQLINQSHLCTVRITKNAGESPIVHPSLATLWLGLTPVPSRLPCPRTPCCIQQWKAEEVKSPRPQELFRITLSPPLLGPHSRGRLPPARAEHLLSLLLRSLRPNCPSPPWS